jgi:protein tyrosine kinase modulator
MHEFAEQFAIYARAAWRYRWYATAATWAVALAGWWVVQQMPDQYEANARVYVDTQSILRPLLSGLAVQPNLDQTMAMMSRTLMSRINVEKVIRMAGMDASAGTAENRERLVARLTQELTIKSTGRENLYAISYTDKDPVLAKRVVESLLNIFLEGSIGRKLKDSDSAKEFIDDQLKTYSEKLIAAENAVTQFKRRNQGLMPGEGRDFYGPLIEAKSALRQATLAFKEAINSRDAIKQQLAGEVQATPQAPPGRIAPIPPPSDIELRIRALEQKLDGLRLTYTDLHPDVVAASRTLERLKAERAEEVASKKLAQSNSAEAPGRRVPQGPLYEQLSISLANAEVQVAAMKARVTELETRYAELQAAANRLPEVEAEYKQLTRDYDVIRTRYDKLLERRESAQISGELEASDSASAFRVIDPPQVPLNPTAPNRPRLVTVILLAALAAGLGVAFVLSQIRTTFDDERRLHQATGLRVLGAVSLAMNTSRMRLRSWGRTGFAMSFVGLLTTYGAIMTMLLASSIKT